MGKPEKTSSQIAASFTVARKNWTSDITDGCNMFSGTCQGCIMLLKLHSPADTPIDNPKQVLVL